MSMLAKIWIIFILWHAEDVCKLKLIVLKQGYTPLIVDYTININPKLYTPIVYGFTNDQNPYVLNIKQIENWSFKGCTGLNKVIVGSGLASIGSWAFENCYSLALLDFRNSQQIPNLSLTAALTNTPTTCQIVVPDALYDTWIVATNWTTYADRIVKASEFVEPTNE